MNAVVMKYSEKLFFSEIQRYTMFIKEMCVHACERVCGGSRDYYGKMHTKFVTMETSFKVV
jgi:hypothetical protein